MAKREKCGYCQKRIDIGEEFEYGGLPLHEWCKQEVERPSKNMYSKTVYEKITPYQIESLRREADALEIKAKEMEYMKSIGAVEKNYFHILGKTVYYDVNGNEIKI